MALLDPNLDDDTRHGGANRSWFIGGFLPRDGLYGRVLVFDGDSANLHLVNISGIHQRVEEKRYLAIDFKPNISLSFTLNHRTDSHQADNESLPFLDRDVHFFSNVWTPQEVPGWDHTGNTL